MNKDPILAEVDGEGMIIDVDRGTSYFLNETALLLYKMTEGGKSIDEMKTALMTEYDVDEKAAERDIRDFTAKLEGKMAQWGRSHT